MSSARDRIRRQLAHTRGMTERLLADFATPEQWLHQVQPGANHALWCVGHLAHTDNFLLSIAAPALALPKATPWAASPFGMGSQPAAFGAAEAASYPSAEELLAAMRDRRTALLAALDEATDERLTTATPKGTPDFMPDYAAVFETAVWHEGLHAGQLTVARKSLGFPPIMGG